MASLWVLCGARGYVLIYVITTSFTSQSQYTAKSPEYIPFIPILTISLLYLSFPTAAVISLVIPLNPALNSYRYSIRIDEGL